MALGHIQVIVEGQGDENAILRLLARAWQELGGDYLEPLRPFRQPQGTLRKEAELSQAINAAWIQLGYRASPQIRRGLLLLTDSEGDCPCGIGPKTTRVGQEGSSGRRHHLCPGPSHV